MPAKYLAAHYSEAGRPSDELTVPVATRSDLPSSCRSVEREPMLKVFGLPWRDIEPTSDGLSEDGLNDHRVCRGEIIVEKREACASPIRHSDAIVHHTAFGHRSRDGLDADARRELVCSGGTTTRYDSDGADDTERLREREAAPVSRTMGLDSLMTRRHLLSLPWMP